MRVLHIGKFFPPHPGGIERTCADLCAELGSKDVATAVLAHADPGTWRSRSFRHGAIEVTLAACPGQWLYAPVSPGFGWRLSRLIRQFKPDLLHVHLPNTSAFWALLLPVARRMPWIVHWHADIPLDSRRKGLRFAYRLYRPWEQALLRRASAVIATSTPYRDSSAALAPWREKTWVIPLGLPELTPSPPTASGERVGVKGQRLDETSSPTETSPPHPALSPIASDGGEGKSRGMSSQPTPDGEGEGEAKAALVWPEPGLRVLAVGRLSYFKGFDVLLRAIARLPQASLLLIGDGECGVALRRLANDLGISDRVNFAGRVDMDAAGAKALANAYADADVFCLPSTERAESFGLVLLEAMRAGKPVIASDIPGSGIGFVVRDGETGVLVPPSDVTALVSALTDMVADHGLRQHLGDAGRQRWQREFTADRSARQVLSLYREILETSRRDTAAPRT